MTLTMNMTVSLSLSWYCAPPHDTKASAAITRLCAEGRLAAGVAFAPAVGRFQGRVVGAFLGPSSSSQLKPRSSHRHIPPLLCCR